MTASAAARLRSAHSRSRLVIMALVGTVAAVVCGTLGAWDYAPLVGWDLAAATFTVWVWLAIGTLDAAQTAAHARREDPDPAATDALTLAASVASLIAVGVVLVAASSAKGSKEWAWPAWPPAVWPCPGAWFTPFLPCATPASTTLRAAG